MSKREWQARLADFIPLYEAGAYTSSEFFWFALPLFDGESGDRELWGALPQHVKDCFIKQLEKCGEMDNPAGAAVAQKLSMLRRVAMQ